jgi:predicted ester cyclase
MGPDGDVPGHDAIRAFLQGMFTVFPNFHVEPGLLRHGDDHVLVEVTLTGAQGRRLGGNPKNGKSFATRLAAVFDFEADQLVCERVYMDFGDIARQLTEP